jgi:hypothetical protein
MSSQRGLTLAPRVEVYTQLSCNVLQHKHYNNVAHTNILPSTPYNDHSHFYYSLDPLSPTLSGLENHSFPKTVSDYTTDDEEEEDPRYLPSHKCLSDPAVQARAARLSTVMTVVSGSLTALTTGWWGRFGERHGRTRVLATATLGLFLS